MALDDFLAGLDRVAKAKTPTSGKYSGEDAIAAELMDYEDQHEEEVKAQNEAAMADMRRRGLVE